MNNNNAFKINIFKDLKTHLIICENIFENPTDICNHAYKQYKYSIRKAFGYVCNWGIITMDMLHLYSVLLKLNIYLKAHHFLFISTGFNPYPHTDGVSLVDLNFKSEMCLASVIYLNPKLDETNYTAFYEHYKCTNRSESVIANITSFVGNRFNKLVIYDGLQYHSAGKGFGNDINNPNDIRLTATYFFDAYH